MSKIASRALLALYVLLLIWLVLFKLTPHLSSIFLQHHRSLNLVPFKAPSMADGSINLSDIILNCIFFIPLGALLGVNFKAVRLLSKLAFILAFSVTAELIQYIFAIGATDITDVITNSAGGLIGLKLYDLGSEFITPEKLDRTIIVVGTLLLALFISVYVTHFVRMSGRRLIKRPPLNSSVQTPLSTMRQPRATSFYISHRIRNAQLLSSSCSCMY